MWDLLVCSFVDVVIILNLTSRLLVLTSSAVLSGFRMHKCTEGCVVKSTTIATAIRINLHHVEFCMLGERAVFPTINFFYLGKYVITCSLHICKESTSLRFPPSILYAFSNLLCESALWSHRAFAYAPVCLCLPVCLPGSSNSDITEINQTKIGEHHLGIS